MQIGNGKKIYSKTKEIGLTSIIVQNIELALRDKLSPLLFSLFTANLGFILANCGAEPFFADDLARQQRYRTLSSRPYRNSRATA